MFELDSGKKEDKGERGWNAMLERWMWERLKAGASLG